MGRGADVIRATGFLSGVGGTGIFWQSWSPNQTPRALIVIAHGAGEHSGRYEHVADALVTDGYAVYALDHRGHGRSDGSRALIDRLDYAVADLDRLVLEAAGEHSGAPTFLLGHSVGATVALSYAIHHQDRIAGLMLSGALASLDAAPAPLRIVGKVLSTIAPTLPLIAVDASLVSRDPEVVSAYVSDPLVHHGKLPARTVAELATAVDGFPTAVGAITVPTLILYGTADSLCPPAGSIMLSERIGAADKTVKAYEGLYHEIFNEPERDAVLADVREWLAARLVAPTGSGAVFPAAGSSAPASTGPAAGSSTS